jgi:hypothetical protein
MSGVLKLPANFEWHILSPSVFVALNMQSVAIANTVAFRDAQRMISRLK